MNVANYFKSSSERVATHIILQADGTPYQLYSTDYYAYHLGLTTEIFSQMGVPYKQLDKTSIGVEICNAGGLTYKNGKWMTSYNTSIANDKVIEYPNGFRGFKAFEKYTDEQIQTVKELLLFWKQKWNIPLTYNDEIFDIYKPALEGVPGVYTHCSVKRTKSDIHPQPEMIAMLQSLE
jgi:N-acetyl-anhydromuramyl-L-alanine amidase AmpD